jgi:hypothetical protein
MGFLVLIFTLPAFYFDRGWSLFYAGVAAAMLVLLLVGLFKGPTCKTELRTAVQTEKLYTLHRLKTASKVMDSLRIQIQQTQGTLSRDALNKMPAQPLKSRDTHRQGLSRSSKKAAPHNENGRAHMGLFVLLLLDAALVSLGFFFTHVMLTIMGSIAILCMGILVIVALVKQQNSNLGGSLRAITWTTLGFLCINFAAGYIVSIVYATQNPGIVYNQWEIFKSMSLLSPWESPLKLSFDIFTICGAAFLGIPGLFMLHRSARGSKAQPIPGPVKLRQPAVQRNTEAG